MHKVKTDIFRTTILQFYKDSFRNAYKSLKSHYFLEFNLDGAFQIFNGNNLVITFFLVFIFIMLFVYIFSERNEIILLIYTSNDALLSQPTSN